MGDKHYLSRLHNESLWKKREQAGWPVAGGKGGAPLERTRSSESAQFHQEAWGIPGNEATDTQHKAVSHLWPALHSRKDWQTHPMQRPTELECTSERQSRLQGEVLPLPAPLSKAMETFMRAGTEQPGGGRWLPAPYSTHWINLVTKCCMYVNHIYVTLVRSEFSVFPRELL